MVRILELGMSLCVRWVFSSLLAGLAALASGPVGATQTEKIDGDRLLDPDRLLEIRIELAPGDWQTLCGQSRNAGAIFTGGAIDDPFVYFPATVWIDGTEIEQVGVRKKGLIGSDHDRRPSLKIKFDEYVDQAPVEGLNRLTLNNNKQDISQLSAFLTYQVFRDAGVHAPRCSLATVTVNGMALGIYSHVESIKRPFLARSFGDDSGNLYEGALSDFHPRTIQNFDVKTNKVDNDPSNLARIAELLAEPALDLEELEKVLDLDDFLRFWAVESLVLFWDGYSANQNNYYYYVDPTTNLGHFIPWGADSGFTQGFAGLGDLGRGLGGSPTSAVYAQSMLCNKLFHTEDIPERYRETIQELLDEVWDEQELEAEILRLEELIAGDLDREQSKAPEAMDQVADFIWGRREVLEEQLDDWPPEVPSKPRTPSYAVPVGAVSGAFSTEWSEGPGAEATGPGQAEVRVEFDGEEVALTSLEVTAQKYEAPRFPGFGGRRGRGLGRGASGSSQVSVVLSGVRSEDDEPLTITMVLDRAAFEDATGEPIEVTGSVSEGRGAGGGLGSGFGAGGRIKTISGKVRLTKAGTSAGASVVGEVDLRISELHGGFFDQGGD